MYMYMYYCQPRQRPSRRRRGSTPGDNILFYTLYPVLCTLYSIPYTLCYILYTINL